MTLLSVSAYARHRGVAHSAVFRAIRTGRITKDKNGLIDPEKADAEWIKNTSPAQQRHASSEQSVDTSNSSGPNYAQSRAIKEAYHARLAKLAYEEKSATLVRADQVKVAWFNVLRVLRDRTLNLPDRLSPLLAAEIDPKIIHDLLDSELRQILDDAADTIAKS